MTKEKIMVLIGMYLNAKKQADENRAAIIEETGVDPIISDKHRIQLLEDDFMKVVDGLGEQVNISERKTTEYPYEVSVKIDCVTIFTICNGYPTWAEEVTA